MNLLESQQQASPDDLIQVAKRIHHTPEDLTDGDLYERIWKFSTYVLRDIPISQLDLTEWDVDHERAMEYARMDGDHEPIIYDADADSIIDGTHRANAASLRGDETIRAWVGLPENIDPDHRINEVAMIDDFGDGGYEMERVFRRWTNEGEDAPVVGNINGYELRNKEINGRSMYYLFKSGECFGRATVDPAFGLDNTVKVAHIVVHPNHRRNGLGLGVYEFIMQSKKIVSDYDHTRFGRAMWQQLANKHVVRPLELDDSVGAPIKDTSHVYGTRTRMVASLR